MPVRPWRTTFSPRPTNPQVASSATATLSRPRPSKKSTERTSASGYLRPALLVRLRTFCVMKSECASSTAIWTRSANAIPAHTASSWAERAASSSAAPISLSLRAVSA